jgi:hypothetical protein
MGAFDKVICEGNLNKGCSAWQNEIWKSGTMALQDKNKVDRKGG